MRISRLTPEDVVASTPHTGRTGVSDVTATTQGAATPGRDGNSGTILDFTIDRRRAASVPTCSADRKRSSLETQNENATRNVRHHHRLLLHLQDPEQDLYHPVLLGELYTFSDVYHAAAALAFIKCCVNPVILVGKYERLNSLTTGHTAVNSVRSSWY